MDSRMRVVLVAALAIGCGHATAKRTRARSTPTSVCGPAIRGADAVLTPGSITLLGEIHGTDAAPRMAGDLLCHAAEAAGSDGVVLALEIGRSEQRWLDAALAADDERSAHVALMQSAHFHGFPDGRSSRAVGELVERARSLRRAGLAIALVAFDGDAQQHAAGRPRDDAMAANLASAIAAHPLATVLVLAGNAHVGTELDTQCAQPRPMGAKLRESYPRVRALNLAHRGGTAWTCGGRPGQTREEVKYTCGATTLEGVDLGDTPFIELHDEPDACGHHGRFYVGTIRASPPAAR